MMRDKYKLDQVVKEHKIKLICGDVKSVIETLQKILKQKWKDTTFNKQELVKKVAKLIAAQVDEFAKEDYFTELYEEAALEIINLVIDETTEPWKIIEWK